MTSPSGQLEAGEVTAEQREAAHAFLGVDSNRCISKLYPLEFNHTERCERIASALSERDAAAERRGAEREREACANVAKERRADHRDGARAMLHDGDKAASEHFHKLADEAHACMLAIRARGK